MNEQQKETINKNFEILTLRLAELNKKILDVEQEIKESIKILDRDRLDLWKIVHDLTEENAKNKYR